MPAPHPASGFLRSLRGRLTLLACLATFPAFLFVLFAAGRERDAALRRAEREVRSVAGLASREHALQVLGAQRLLRRLADPPGGKADLEALARTLPAVRDGFPQVANLGILGTDGKVRTSVVPLERPVDMSTDPAFGAALASGDVVMGRYQVGRIVGRPILIMARAVRDGGGKALGVVFAALDLDWLDRLALQARLPEGCALLILDRGGTVLARSQGPGRDAAEPGEPIPRFEALARGGPGLTEILGRDGVPRLFAASPLEGVPDLEVAVGLPRDRVLGEANRAFSRALAALAFLTFLTVASSIAAADLTVLRDLRALGQATRRLGSGDLKARAPLPRGRGEIRDLAEAFNGMADALEGRQQEAEAASDAMRDLSRRLQAVREEECARIARELHDQLGQELTALKLGVARAAAELRKASPGGGGGEVEQVLEDVGASIDGCVDSVRTIASELRPGILDRLGLEPALEWLARRFSREAGIPCAFRGDEAPAPGEAQATALFRIAQEALTNVARHARASRADVDLSRREGHLVLTIRDDGAGFDPDRPGSSLGILGMRERARILGGSLEVACAPGRGTRVTAKIPLEAP